MLAFRVVPEGPQVFQTVIESLGVKVIRVLVQSTWLSARLAKLG